MRDTIYGLMKIIPKEVEILKRRYKVLKGLRIYQPIGRRGLAEKIKLSEKAIRNDTDFLKNEGFLRVTPVGMYLETKGEHLLDDLRELVEELDGLGNIEAQIRKILGCVEVVVVPGDVDTDPDVAEILGKVTASLLIKKLRKDDILALTGGSTISHVVKGMEHFRSEIKRLRIVPARGSLGTNVTYQANTLVGEMANMLHAKYRLLNLPDNLSQKALASVREEPEIQETLELLSQSTVLLYGVGNAKKMAKRRNLAEDTKDLLKSQQAVAEALGDYYNKEGEVIFTSRSIGITIDQMPDLRESIAVAGGSSKAETILAVKDLLARGCVIMDEGAANGILSLHKNKVRIQDED